MILGNGVDIAEIDRIERALAAKHGELGFDRVEGGFMGLHRTRRGPEFGPQEFQLARLRFRFHIHPPKALGPKAANMGQHMIRLILDHLKDRAIIRIRSVQHEQVRKAHR